MPEEGRNRSGSGELVGHVETRAALDQDRPGFSVPIQGRLDVASLEVDVAEAADTTADPGEIAGEPVLLRRPFEQRLGAVEVPVAGGVVGKECHPPTGRRVVAEAEEELHALFEQGLGALVVPLLSQRDDRARAAPMPSSFHRRTCERAPARL